MKLKIASTLAALLLPIFGAALAGPAAASYTMADFDKVEKIDAHMHLHNDARAFMRLARKDKFKVLAINVDYADFPPLEQQRRIAAGLRRDYPQDAAFVASFSMVGFEQPDWAARTVKGLEQGLADGAVGVKVWKNIGMELRGANGALLTVQDPRLDPVFGFTIENHIALLGHQGEPKNCWLPLSEMTVNNDREYFKAHPQYHMYLHPEMPGYEAQMAARDAMLDGHPGLRFVGMHMASLEWDVDVLARFLERYPNANVDLAARMGQLQYQSGRAREHVRQFLIKYQDRLMYGSDLAQSSEQGDRLFNRDVDTVWRRDWRYFVSADSFAVPELDGPVRGLSLPRAVVDKLYRINAEKAYPRAWHSSK
jgi:hypothetical protein